MVFGDLERESLIGSAGVFLSYPQTVSFGRVEWQADVALSARSVLVRDAADKRFAL